MNFDYLYRRSQFVYPAVGLLVILIIWKPVKNTYKLFGHTKQLSQIQGEHMQETRNTRQLKKDAVLLLYEQKDVNSILEELSISARQNQTIITQVSSPHASESNQVSVLTEHITIEGDFADLLKTLHDIQPKLSPVKISSVRFDRIERNKVAVLRAQVVFQSVKTPHYEK